MDKEEKKIDQKHLIDSFFIMDIVSSLMTSVAMVGRARLPTAMTWTIMLTTSRLLRRIST